MGSRVVITGLGIVSPIGIGIPSFWQAALKGISGVSTIKSFGDFPMEMFRSRIAGQVFDFSPIDPGEDTFSSRVDRYAQFALMAAREAIRDSQLDLTEEPRERIGIAAGVGMGGMIMGERELTTLYLSQKPHRVHPNFIPTITLNSASGILSLAFGAKGPNTTISTACSSSIHAIGQGMHMIRSGQADLVIAAGADASITPLVFAGFCSLRALSTKYNDHPTKASRPFDRGRDGFVMGEGAGVLILESLRHATRRKARLYAELVGYAATSEAYHMVIPREDGSDIARTMRLALKDAGMTPKQVDYINAHATATTVGDDVEIKGFRTVFGKRADKILVNATKSLIGHTLGAAGAIGTIASVLSLQSGMIHPTINYDDPDPSCMLPGLSNALQQRPIHIALVNAFGFGSNNGVLVLKGMS
ncbi:MAG: beta-ketoacyl-ACP synthase II [Nitrospirales bacterium]|nr:beta-ketoacyl-ACP synthase II [Nitrospirales bacterium]